MKDQKFILLKNELTKVTNEITNSILIDFRKNTASL